MNYVTVAARLFIAIMIKNRSLFAQNLVAVLDIGGEKSSTSNANDMMDVDYNTSSRSVRSHDEGIILHFDTSAIDSRAVFIMRTAESITPYG